MRASAAILSLLFGCNSDPGTGAGDGDASGASSPADGGEAASSDGDDSNPSGNPPDNDDDADTTADTGGDSTGADPTDDPSTGGDSGEPPGSGLLADCGASDLADLAEALGPGEFVELPTIGLTPEFSDSTNGHDIFQYTWEAMWDPNTCQAVFIGGGHLTITKYVTYSASANEWAIVTDPPFFCPPSTDDGSTAWGCVDHAYGWNAIDQDQGVFYYHRSGVVHRTEINADLSGEWTALPDPPESVNYSSIAYHQALSSVVLVTDQALYLFEDGADAWTSIDGPFAMGDYHWYGVYNPVEEAMLFGSGNGSAAMNRLDADGTVTAVSDAPNGFHPENEGSDLKILTVDPLWGRFLAYSRDGSLHQYDVSSDTWSLAGTQLPENMDLAVPVTSYGVVMFFNRGSVYLYAHQP